MGPHPQPAPPSLGEGARGGGLPRSGAAATATRPNPPVSPWADAACLLAGILTPLVFHPFGTLGFEATKGTLVELLALVLGLGWLARFALRFWPPALARRSVHVRDPALSLWLALGAYTASLAISTALSVAPAVSVWGSYDRIQGLVALLAWVILGLAAAAAGRSGERRRTLSASWVLASVPVCVYALMQQFRLDPIDWLGRPIGVTSTLGSSTALSTYLAMVAPLTLALLVAAGRELRAAEKPANADSGHAVLAGPAPAAIAYGGWVALLGLQVAVIVMASVRGGLLGLLAGGGVAATAMTWRLQPSRWVLAAVLALVVMAGGGLALSSPSSVLPSLVARGAETSLEDGSARQRVLIWQASLQSVAEAGWRSAVGFGPETQALVLERHFPAELAARYPNARFDRAHNLLVDQLLARGMIGVLALIGGVVVLARGGLAAVGGSDPEHGLLAAGLLGALTANLMAGLFSFDSITSGTLFWMTAGLLVAPTLPARAEALADEPRSARSRGAGDGPPARGTRAAAVLLAASFGLIALPRVVGPFMADLYHTRALALRAGEAPAASTAAELAAVSWAPQQDVYYLALAEAYQEIARTTSDPAGAAPGSFEALYESTPTGREALFHAARLSLERAASLSPLDPYSHVHLARFWALWSEVSREAATRDERLRRAVAEYDRAISLSPNRATFYDEMGVALIGIREPDAAIGRFRQADGLGRPTAERLARIGEAETLRWNVAAARDLYLRALSLDPRSAPAEHGLALLDRDSGDLVSAAEHGQRATRFQMRNWVYRRDLALILRDMERWSQALIEARAARRFAPAWEWDDLTVLVDTVRR